VGGAALYQLTVLLTAPERMWQAFGITLTIEIASTSETSVCFYETSRRCVPEVCDLHARRSESLKSHLSEVRRVASRGREYVS
jgi:hypothetical protein